MPSSYSPDLRFELPADGEQAGLWGQTSNRNLGTLVESAIAGSVAVSVTTANQALTALNGVDDQSRHAMLVLSTTTGANFSVYAPPASKTYIVRNTSSFTGTIYNSTVLGGTTAAGTGVAVPAGKTLVVFSDGTNFRTIDAVNLTGTLAVANGGTGATDASGARTNLGLVIGTNVPSPTGTGASGTWGISIAGNAATATSATTATQLAATLGIAGGGTGATTAAAAFDALKQAATETATGVVELATTAEAAAGTDTTRVLTPSGLRGGLNATGTAPVYGCRAWVNFDGTKDTTGAVSTANTNRLIRASGNVTSVLRNAVGDFTVTFATAMPDANFSTLLTTSNSGTVAPIAFREWTAKSAASVRLKTASISPAQVDLDEVCVSIFR